MRAETAVCVLVYIEAVVYSVHSRSMRTYDPAF